MGFAPRVRPQRNDSDQHERSIAVTLAELGAVCGGALRWPPGSKARNGRDVTIHGVCDDSRGVAKGDVFVAVRGARVDGHRYAGIAVRAGAVAVVAEQAIEELTVPQLIVHNSQYALAQISAHLEGTPARDLTLVGVTGTNGKTTTSYLVESLLRSGGREPGVMGTVTYRYGHEVVSAPYTTPTAPLLHSTLASMRDAGCRSAVLEVSSAALAMNRLHGVQFSVAAFSNLTQDHLDLHGTFARYCQAKAKLFSEHLGPSGVAVINMDDPSAQMMIEAAGDHRIITVSALDDSADVFVVSQETSVAGIRAALRTPRGSLLAQSASLFGSYNVANIALAVGIGEGLGLSLEVIEEGIASMAGVPGRLERVKNRRHLDVFVDYAHTPDALRNVLSALRPLTQHRLIAVFGCGGDRDPSKRPMMGAAVSELADLAVVTSDNPRTESPEQILNDILPAVPDPFLVHSDRRIAIAAAIDEACPGDVVVIAGKGHEDYQILGTEKVHFDDREVASAAIAARWTFTPDSVVAATGARCTGRSAASDDVEFLRVAIDSRQVRIGDLYVAIVGDRLDGHDFCLAAAQAGALGVVVARDKKNRIGKLPKGTLIFDVPDPRVALGALARVHRRRWGRLVVGITGSAGKTSTKDLSAAALASLGPVLATQGSLNNETGVPLTLLGLRSTHRVAVIEMGMRGLGQIAELCAIAEPDIGVVVNAGTAHLGVLGSEDAIVQGKSEMFAALPSYGCAIYPVDDARLARNARASQARTVRTFGYRAGDVSLTSYQPTDGGSAIVLSLAGQEATVRLPWAGRHNALNAACATAVAQFCGVPLGEIVVGLESSSPSPLRSEIRNVAGRRVFVDCYNANPAAMSAALTTVRELAGAGHALAVLGDMLELGPDADAAHREAGRRAASLGFELVVLGAHRQAVVDGARESGGAAQITEDTDSAAAAALARSKPGDWILLKASRGMKLERVIDAMMSSEGL